ncbi:TPA: hypothetical protein R7I69_000774 [Klebsiella pneumoniae]|nr:hypothetical protein [Klebsiella pneumoniae]
MKHLAMLALLVASASAVAGNCDSYYGTAADGSQCGLRSHDSRVQPGTVQQAPQSTHTNYVECLPTDAPIGNITEGKSIYISVDTDPQNKSMDVKDIDGYTHHYFYAGYQVTDEGVMGKLHIQFYSTLQESDDANNVHNQLMLNYLVTGSVTSPNFRLRVDKVQNGKQSVASRYYICKFGD